MDGLEFLNGRRSTKIPDLIEPGPSAAQINDILSAAIRVPDHGKLAPWRFILYEGDARRKAGEALAEIFAAENPEAAPDQIAFERDRFARAPLVIAVVSCAQPHPKIPEWEQILSAGAITMALELAVHAVGYACKWVTEWYAYDGRAMNALGLRAHERVAGFVYIGSASQPAEERPRPPLADIVTRYEG